MQLKVKTSEIQALLADKGISIYFEPVGRTDAKIGLNPVLSIPVRIGIYGTRLQLQYTSGLITGRVVNTLIGLFRSQFSAVDIDLTSPGVIGVDLASVRNADKLFAMLDVQDLYFEGDAVIAEGKLK